MNNCTGHGICRADVHSEGKMTCFCQTGWRGKDCSLALCPRGKNGLECNANGQCDGYGVCSCHKGWTGKACAQETCKQTCFNGGTCHHKSKKCTCPEGFAGDQCEVKLCPHHCRGNGKCGGNGQCICDLGWEGDSCEIKTCPKDPQTLLDCYGNGMCSNGTCSCLAGWSGQACQTLICPNNCLHHKKQGECLNNKCECYPGFGGIDCSVQLSRKDPAGPGGAKEGGDVCGEDCDAKCQGPESGCTTHQQQVFVFSTANNQTTTKIVPITKGTGVVFDKWVQSQRDVQKRDMPEITRVWSTDRACLLQCYQKCTQQCFEDLSELGPEERRQVIETKNLRARIPSLSGTAVDAGASNSSSAGTLLAMLSDVKANARGAEGGGDDEDTGSSTALPNPDTPKAAAEQVPSVPKEEPSSTTVLISNSSITTSAAART